jgi:predicted small secreted protein
MKTKILLLSSFSRAASIAMMVLCLPGFSPFAAQSLEQRVEVVEEKGLKISSDKDSYQHGDAMKIKVEVPADGYIVVYGVNVDGSTVILIPNPWNRNNRVKAGTITFPEEGDRYHFPLTLDRGLTQVTEVVHVVFSTHQFDSSALVPGELTSKFVEIGVTTASERNTRGLVPTAKKRSSNAELKYNLNR